MSCKYALVLRKLELGGFVRGAELMLLDGTIGEGLDIGDDC